MRINLRPCELKGNMRICSWDLKVVLDCGCLECEASKRVFGRSFASAGMELTAAYDRIKGYGL